MLYTRSLGFFLQLSVPLLAFLDRKLCLFNLSIDLS